MTTPSARDTIETAVDRWLDRRLRKILGWMLAFYRVAISPVFGPACRFEPSCSRYASEAIDRYGAIQGLWLGVKRLCRCHPLGGSGYDPVPEGIE